LSGFFVVGEFVGISFVVVCFVGLFLEKFGWKYFMVGFFVGYFFVVVYFVALYTG